MGLKDTLKNTLRAVWSPITVWMADEGSDRLVEAGQPAKVVVVVNGEDDGTADRVEITLELVGDGGLHAESWPLGEVPAVVGRHETTVTIPPGLQPSCALFAEYAFAATLHRTKGVGSSAKSVVDVVARAEDVSWPEGSRSGLDGDFATGLAITLDDETAAAGASVSGRVYASTTEPVTVIMGAFVVAPRQDEGHVQGDRPAGSSLPGSAFSLLVPEGCL